MGKKKQTHVGRTWACKECEDVSGISHDLSYFTTPGPTLSSEVEHMVLLHDRALQLERKHRAIRLALEAAIADKLGAALWEEETG